MKLGRFRNWYIYNRNGRLVLSKVRNTHGRLALATR